MSATPRPCLAVSEVIEFHRVDPMNRSPSKPSGNFGDVRLDRQAKTLDARLSEIHDLLVAFEATNTNLLRQARALLGDHRIASLSDAAAAVQSQKRLDLGFNCFAVISDTYYRENLHSDVISAILDPAGAHGHGSAFLNSFLEWLSGLHPAVAASNYTKARVAREQGRVDILIVNDDTKRVIIIENKINAAADMRLQIPRYLDYVEAQNLHCDAILYLRLTGHTGPDRTDWTPDDHKRVDKRLVIARAYDGSGEDMIQGWLDACISATPPENDASYLLRQYKELLEFLGHPHMNKPLLEAFYQLMLDEPRYKSACAIQSLLKDLSLYRVERVIEVFRAELSPFSQVANYQNVSAYFTGLHWQGAHLGIDVVMQHPEFTEVQFWDRSEGREQRAKQVLESLGIIGNYFVKDHSGRHLFCRHFRFPSEETALYDYLRSFKRLLNDFVS